FSRLPLQDGLVYLCFKSSRFVGCRAERSEYRSSCRQVTYSLGDSRLLYEGIHIVRRDIKQLVELLYRVGKTTKNNIGNRVLVKQVDVTRVEAFCSLEIRLALLPPALPPCDICEQLRNSTAIGQELACLLKMTYGGVIILQAGVVIIALGKNSLS